MLSYNLPCADDNIFCFTTTRSGGVSEGEYESLNLGLFSGDLPDRVIENRNRLSRAIGVLPERLFLPYQTHGIKVKVIESGFTSLNAAEQEKQLHGVDALVTACREVCIGVTTADCVPILLYCPQQQVIAAIHAGWRGTVGDIVGECLRVMVSRFNCCLSSVVAVIGPSICKDWFEVGDEVADAFSTLSLPSGLITTREITTGKYHIDLWETNRLLLVRAGISPRNIEIAGICTRTNHNRFFSARKAGISSGRFVSGILLRPAAKNANTCL